MARIVVVGEALVDLVGRPDGSTYRADPGGSPANVAVGLGRLGAPATLVCGLGEDAFGRLVAAHVAGSGVRLARQPCPFTCIAVVSLDAAGAASYDFAWSWEPGPVALPPDLAALHTGSLAAALPGAEHVEAAMRAARGGATVSYDPNIRPVLLGERAGERARVERQVALSDVVKASDEDLAWLYPDADPVDIAGTWLGLGPSLVVVTHGALGATAVGAEVVRRPAPQVRVADTVGAGDAFMAGLLAGLHRSGLLGGAPLAGLSGDTIAALVDHAIQVAAITCTREGADPPSAAQLY